MAASSSSSYWCYSCSRFVRISPRLLLLSRLPHGLPRGGPLTHLLPPPPRPPPPRRPLQPPHPPPRRRKKARRPHPPPPLHRHRRLRPLLRRRVRDGPPPAPRLHVRIPDGLRVRAAPPPPLPHQLLRRRRRVRIRSPQGPRFEVVGGVHADRRDLRPPRRLGLPLRRLHGGVRGRDRGPGDAVRAHLPPGVHTALAGGPQLLPGLPARDARGRESSGGGRGGGGGGGADGVEAAGRRVRGGDVLRLGRSREGGSGAAVGVHGDGRGVQCRCGPEEGHVGRGDGREEGEERRAEEALQEVRVVVRTEGRRLIRTRRTAGWSWGV
ncbi:putative E3 ubiquitin-protein ligase RING1 [Iris pallida]|uniref:E3 ubiquitin-protein ligase RING1 n=1 Tax=Iris pallida TaxID=29817 RepID=A0AAX6HVB9_IRIPA|nr:putative E3 ubiquitin-protein ligase RING1 [Iris pallida]